MAATLGIGDFSRATQMSVKALRHYHRIGLLVPAEVDRSTSYRRYTEEQIRHAQVIRRFRDLQMPLEEIRAVMEAPSVQERNALIGRHLDQLERALESTAGAVASLRDLLTGPDGADDAAISYRAAPAVTAAAISTTLAMEEAGLWFQGAVGELYATLRAQGLRPTGPPGGVYGPEVFTTLRGPATVFVPVAGEPATAGRVRAQEIPAAELAVIVHRGSHDDVDRSYGALAAHVTRHALGVDGPTREYYLVGLHNADRVEDWETEICWPIFRTVADEHGAA
jgi:DNA-binding transcriptional MerR regulator